MPGAVGGVGKVRHERAESLSHASRGKAPERLLPHINADRLRPVSRMVRLTFAGLALFFVLFPLTLQKPGLPQDLKSDEPAYYLMALSLVHDFDLRCETKDIQRLTNEFPYNNANNLILMTDDDWQTVWFGKPYLVSLLAAPAVAIFGANGFLATNMALLMFVDLDGRALSPALQSGRAGAALLGRFLPALERLRLRFLDPHRSALHGLGHRLSLPRLHAGRDRRSDRPLGALRALVLERRQPAGLVGGGDHRRRLQQADPRPPRAAGALPRLPRGAHCAGPRSGSPAQRSPESSGLRHIDRLHRPPLRLPRRRALRRARPRLHPHARPADRPLRGLQGGGARSERTAQLLVVDLPAARGRSSPAGEPRLLLRRPAHRAPPLRAVLRDLPAALLRSTAGVRRSAGGCLRPSPAWRSSS